MSKYQDPEAEGTAPRAHRRARAGGQHLIRARAEFLARSLRRGAIDFDAFVKDQDAPRAEIRRAADLLIEGGQARFYVAESAAGRRWLMLGLTEPGMKAFGGAE